MPSPALPGLLFCAAACILLIFTCVSAPTWNKISFMNVNQGGQTLHFGAFGYSNTGTGGGSGHTMVGYKIPPNLFADQDSHVQGLNRLTAVMILHPIAAAFAGLAVLFGLCGSAYSRIGTILMAISAAIATIVVFVVFVIDMVLWGIAIHRIDHNTGYNASYGNANWLTAGAVLALLLGSCSGLFGACGRFRRRRNNKVVGGSTVAPMGTTTAAPIGTTGVVHQPVATTNSGGLFHHNQPVVAQQPVGTTSGGLFHHNQPVVAQQPGHVV